MPKKPPHIEVTDEMLKEATTQGARLKLALAARGITPGTLAKKIQVTRATVHYWFSGSTKKLDSDNLFAAAKILGVRPRWLATGELPMFPKPRMSEAAIALVEFFEHMAEDDRQTLLRTAEKFAISPDTKPSIAAPYRVRRKVTSEPSR